MVTFCLRKLLATGLLSCLVPTISLIAQSEIRGLSAYVDSAERHMPVLLQKKALVAASAAAVADARHSFLPNSYLGDELTAATDNSIPGSYVSFGIIPSSSSGVRPNNIYQAALGNIAFLYNEYELVDFGLKKATIRNAEGSVSLSQADLDREIYLLKWQVAKLYLGIMKSKFQLSIDRENIGRYDTLYKIIQAVTQSGIKPGADSSLAMAELSRTRTTYNQTYGQLRELQTQLSYLTGVSVDRMEMNSSVLFNYTAMQGMLMPRDSGQGSNPLTGYYDKERSLYRLDEELERKRFLPKILLTGVAWGRGSGIDYQSNYKSDPLSGLGFQRFNYMAGLTVQYNLFNSIHRRDKIAILHNDVAAGDFALQQQILSLRNIGNKAEEAVQTASRNLKEVPIQIHAAEDAYHQKTAQYKAGIINLVDLTNASFVLYRSQTDLVQTISDWLAASLDKFAVAGGLDQFIQTIK